MENTNTNSKKKGTGKFQIFRTASQLIFLGTLIAGFYMDIRMIIMILLPATLLFGNFFCGWVCPYGTVQELMGRIGKLIFKEQIKMPKGIQKFMKYSRYVLFVILMIGIADAVLQPINGYGSFLGLFMQNMGSGLSTLAIGIMVAYLLISMVFERAFCNYLCTEAAKYGVLSMTRIFSIKRNESSCVNCSKCDKVCLMNIEVSKHDQVRNGQCINCMKCIDACPVNGTLSYSRVKLPIGKNWRK